MVSFLLPVVTDHPIRVELLHVDHLARSNGHDIREPTPDTDTEGVRVFPPHDDEGQVGLDTRRSFVTYPKGA
jgi:hypothetical protein